MHLWLGFAVAALVLWGVTGVTQKLSTNRISSERSFLWFCWADFFPADVNWCGIRGGQDFSSVSAGDWSVG